MYLCRLPTSPAAGAFVLSCISSGPPLSFFGLRFGSSAVVYYQFDAFALLRGCRARYRAMDAPDADSDVGRLIMTSDRGVLAPEAVVSERSFWTFCSTLVTGLSAVSPPGLILGTDGERSLMFAVLQMREGFES